jgi:hypothetical protein
MRDTTDRSNWKWLSGKDVSVSFWNLPGGGENCARYDGTKGWQPQTLLHLPTP